MSLKKVVVGLSGGVDSAVSAWLLKEQGFDVTGIFMKNWSRASDQACPSEKDFDDVAKVCQTLGIAYYAMDFSHEYYEKVFKDFLEKLEKGYTPNPDILCNKEIKFHVFLDQIEKMGIPYLATGHYTRIENGQLLRAKDLNKDQTYFLYTLEQKTLQKLLFPLGSLEKQEVRGIARRLGLCVSDKKDSTGICFIGPKNLRSFIAGYLKKNIGPICDTHGTVLGEHDGLHFYTLGQRKGILIAAASGSVHHPWFVVGKNVPHNTLIVAQGATHSALFSYTMRVQNMHWIHHDVSLVFPLQCFVKARYRQPLQACSIYPIARIAGVENYWQVDFKEPQRALTPGQSAVFYQGDLVLGGGVIEDVNNPYMVFR